MKHTLALILIVTVAILFSSCPDSSGGGATGTISGTITNTGGYSNLKIGFFPTFGDSEDLKTDYVDSDFDTSGDYSHFLYYNDVDDNSDVTVIPLESESVTDGSYSFTLPTNTTPSTDGITYYYQLAIWADADSDNALDLVDKFNPSASEAGEYSRLPLKDVGNAYPGYVYYWHYVEDQEIDDYTGFKYRVYDGASQTIELTGPSSSYSTGGFNFELD